MCWRTACQPPRRRRLLACTPALAPLLLLLLLAVSSLPAVDAADNLALLSGTLRTYQRAGCDDRPLALWCPQGTSISVQLAQFASSPPPHAHCASAPASHYATQRNDSCDWPKALQYSLLQTVVEACQKKRQCKFQPTARPFGGDPCPGAPKYVHVDYKCRPYEFRSKVACQSETVHLQCNPNARIAVYSASFGRTEYESIQCPQPQGVPEETCLVSYATEIVMRMCHGKRRCTLPADSETFGKPCRSDSRMYLKVVYTCVPRKVLMETIEEAAQADEVTDDHEDDMDAYDTADENGAFSPSPNVQGAGPGLNDRAAGGAAPARDPTTLSPHAPVHDGNINHSGNQEKFYLYLILSVTAGLVLFLGLVIGRLLLQRRRSQRNPKPSAPPTEQTLPNGFTDDLSEAEMETAVSGSDTVLGLVPTKATNVPGRTPPTSVSEVVRFGGSSGIPRSLNRATNSQYYYG